MATITENKQALTDIRNDLQKALAEGLTMARNKEATLEDITAKSAEIDLLEARAALIEQDITAQEREGRANAEQAKGAQNVQKKSAFSCAGEYFAAVYKSDLLGGVRDSRLARISDSATGANETAGADGGYLVPPEYAEGILEFVEGESVLYPQARKVQIAGNRLIEIYLEEYNRADTAGSAPDIVPSTRNGGVMAYWTAEAAQYQASKAKFAERTTNLYKMTAYCPVTEELMQDYPAIEGILGQKVGEEFAFKIDDTMVRGTGNAQPLGVLAYHVSTAAQNNKALVTIAKENGQAADTLVYANIIKMYNALIARKRAKAAWYINQDLETVLMQLLLPTGTIASKGQSKVEDIEGTFGVPIYMPPGAYGNADARLLGLPVKPLEQCSALGDKGDIILMDASQYLIIERTGIQRQSSMHIRFDYDETVFKFTWRVGGRPDWMDTVKPYKGVTERSPYVCLAERA